MDDCGEYRMKSQGMFSKLGKMAAGVWRPYVFGVGALNS